jgi:hypothetical protein
LEGLELASESDALSVLYLVEVSRIEQIQPLCLTAARDVRQICVVALTMRLLRGCPLSGF